ncbi:hypothetical protein BDA99DRAFT_499521 [Phascolomyces articulosus]|uniref:Uncharacterized protein n=1 Tax=Phascolomyces articulosus TaxID=60185 RepID=A0AAD5K7I1_9FUNG|nr:hypothetical protein BDA99DRAFT_499521 [Phascolomyces articulosus]
MRFNIFIPLSVVVIAALIGTVVQAESTVIRKNSGVSGPNSYVATPAKAANALKLIQRNKLTFTKREKDENENEADENDNGN